MCRVIAIANQKGGAGKTTTAKNLGHALSLMGKKVLDIDFDPQFSLSTSLGYDNTDDEPVTISDLMDCVMEKKNMPDKTIYIKQTNGINALLSNIALSSTEMKLVGFFEREFVLKEIVDNLRDDYDYILIDCNPSLGMLVINALAACDGVIIPVDSNYLASKGLELFLRTVIRIMRRINTGIKIEGILLTRYSASTKLSKSSLEAIQEAYGSDINIYSTKIPNSVKVGESDKKGISIIEYMPDNPVSLAYMDFAREVVSNE